MAKKEKAAEAAPEDKKTSKVGRGAKAAAEPAEKAERARKYPATMKIKVLNKENPSREGTGRAEAFQAMLACKTVGDYYETGHKVKYLKTWAESGHIEALGSPDA